MQFLFLSLALMVLYCFIDAVVLFYITGIKYKSYSFFHSLKTCVIGLFYSAITPLSVGGQPVQIVEMTRSKIKFGDASSFIVIKMIIYQVALIFYSLFAILFHEKFVVSKFWFFTVAGLFFNVIFIASVVVISMKKDFVKKLCAGFMKFLVWIKILKISNSNSALQKIYEQIELFHESAKLVSHKKIVIAKLFLITFVQLSIYYLIPFFILKSFGIDVNLYYTLLATSLIYMITSFVPIPGASVANEGAFYIFFKMFFAKQLAIPIIFLWRFVTYYFIILIGGAIIIIDMAKKRPF